MRLLTINAAAARLRRAGVQISATGLRERDAELNPIRVDDGRPNGGGVRVYRADAIDAFAARRARTGCDR